MVCCTYVEDHIEFETNAELNLMIEKKAENFYRMISKKMVAFPNSSMQVKKKVLRGSTRHLPLRKVSSYQYMHPMINYVKKQKEDI